LYNKKILNVKPYSLNRHQAWSKNNKNGIIKLDWNEATKSIFVGLEKHLQNVLINNPVNWYPPADDIILREKICKYVGLHSDNIQYFAGSDTALEIVTNAHSSDESNIIIVSPTYDNYRIYADVNSNNVNLLFPENIFHFDKNLHLSIPKNADIVYLCNPNNPTGWLYPLEYLNFLLKKYPKTIFIIDEAYGEYTGGSCSELVNIYDNLYIIKTFSKAFGLASFRIGYVLSDKNNINFINKIKNYKSITIYATEAAKYALDNIVEMTNYVEEIKESKKIIIEYFEKKNIKFIDTPANFVLLKIRNAENIIKRFSEHNIFIRSLKHLKHCNDLIRITVGDIQSTESFIRIIESNKLLK
jgi:histidinol-phosphate aminotransferase